MVINMECRAFMSSLPANSFDAIVTDPPYGLSKQPDMRKVLTHWLAGDDYTATGGGFMGKSWDSFVPGPKTWEQALRVLKPGGYAVVFAGSRTVDLMATSLRLAGAGCLGTTRRTRKTPSRRTSTGTSGAAGETTRYMGRTPTTAQTTKPPGRWPGNVLHDGCLPEPMDRYFYHAKASKRDREEGLEDFELATAGEVTGGRAEGSDGLNSPRSGAGRTGGARNVHPTVKPTAVMRWLCRLITPPGGTLLDPFCGSGPTLKAAALEGFSAVGCEMDPKYAEIARVRGEWAKCQDKSI